MNNVNEPWYNKLLNSKIVISIIILLGTFAILTYLIVFLFKSIQSGDPFPQEYSSPILAILGVIISIIILTFVSIVFSLIDQSNKRHALGLPQGSVRALIALCLVTSFIIIAVILFNKLNTPDLGKLEGLSRDQFERIPLSEIVSSNVDTLITPAGTDTLYSYTVERAVGVSAEANDFAKQLLTILSTLAIAVSAFYFGSRATEMGGQQAANILRNRNGKGADPGGPAGSGGSGTPSGGTPGASGGTEPDPEGIKRFQSLSEDEQLKIRIDVIEKNHEAWKTLYPNITYAATGKKYIEHENKRTEINCIVFYVKRKPSESNLVPQDRIPKYIDHNGFKIPTDVQVQQESPTSQVARPRLLSGDQLLVRKPGSGISRIDSMEFGSIGLKVYRGDNQDTREEFILSCYHVLFNLEFGQNIESITSNAGINRPEVVCPCLFDDRNGANTNVIADVAEGVITSRVDAAIAKLRRRGVLDDLPELQRPTKIYELVSRDEDNANFRVHMRGRVSTAKSGKVKHVFSTPPITYIFPPAALGSPSPTVVKNMIGLIQVEKISEAGDSGGPVFTQDGKVIGIVVAGTSQYTYVIPIKSIMNRLDISV